MRATRRNIGFAVSGVATLAAATIFPASMGFAFETPAATQAAAQEITTPAIGAPMLTLAPLAPDTNVTDAGPAAADAAAEKLSYTDLDPELECLARAVHYESKGEPRNGQLAVAQVVINRAKSGRFPSTYCGVIHQRGQFASIARHRPNHSSSSWRNAVDVARDAMEGDAAHVAPGAIFFHATYANAAAFKRHDRVTKIGGHIFYR